MFETQKTCPSAILHDLASNKEFDLVDWMRSIDPDLVVYAPSLAENGYKTLKTVRRLNRHTLLQFCPDMKHGHYEAILHEVDRIQTPTSRKVSIDLFLRFLNELVVFDLLVATFQAFLRLCICSLVVTLFWFFCFLPIPSWVYKKHFRKTRVRKNFSIM